MAGALTAVQPDAGYSVKEPVIFGALGVRYLLPVPGKAQPYVLGGFGLANVTQDVKFTVAGRDVTGNMQQYGIVLGTDLTGDFINPILVVGGGVSYSI